MYTSSRRPKLPLGFQIQDKTIQTVNEIHNSSKMQAQNNGVQ
jgi:hypothetical protein